MQVIIIGLVLVISNGDLSFQQVQPLHGYILHVLVNMLQLLPLDTIQEQMKKAHGKWQ